MRSPIPDYLLEVLDACGADAGAVADYIPELAAADPDRFGICVATVDGAVYAAGDADVEFTIQSMSKPFTYALALADRGVDEMDERVGVEPSGEAFNEISLDPETGRPRNAMINAGALLTHSLVDGEDADARSQRVLAGFSRFAGRDLVVDEDASSSEFASAHRNLGMAHLLKASGVLECDPVDVVEGYTRQCSITVSCRDLAMMAATLANAGTHPLTHERLLSRPVVRQVMSVMMTCGMYDAAGDWMTDVGIPAKSGVSGGVIGALPGQVGIAVFSPRLDTHGSSVRGVRVFERLSGDMGMHLMDVAQEGRSALRGSYVSEGEDPVTGRPALRRCGDRRTRDRRCRPLDHAGGPRPHPRLPLARRRSPDAPRVRASPRAGRTRRARHRPRAHPAPRGQRRRRAARRRLPRRVRRRRRGPRTGHRLSRLRRGIRHPELRGSVAPEARPSACRHQQISGASRAQERPAACAGHGPILVVWSGGPNRTFFETFC